MSKAKIAQPPLPPIASAPRSPLTDSRMAADHAGVAIARVRAAQANRLSKKTA